MKTERGLYGLSLITGLIGTVLTVELEVRDSKDNSAVAHRALYTFILLIAGLLFQAARISTSLKADAPSPDRAVVPPRSQSSSPGVREESPPEIRDEKASANSPLSDSGTGVALLELKSAHPGKEEKMEEAESADDDKEATPAEEITTLSAPSFSSTATISPVLATTGWRHHVSSCLNAAHNLIPTAWWAQSLILFLQNALEEPVTSTLLPYTALSGLATGYLFRISIQPWQLAGIRRWIENHRYELVIPECVIDYVLILNGFIKSYFLFSATTASFWMGYNLEEPAALITTKLLQRSSSSSKNSPRQQFRVEQPVFLRWSTALLISLSGAVCSGLSILVIQPWVTTNQAAVRNYAALWMASLGNYALTYPLGIYLGWYLPHRYHDKTLIVATYLLVPFANPELTIPHYLLLLGAGLCGGVAHVILKMQYNRQLTKMQQRKQLTDTLLLDNPPFLHLLSQLSLPNDLLLQQQQQKKRKMTIIIKIVFILQILNLLYLLVNPSTATAPLIAKIGDLIGILTLILIYTGGFHLLPRHIPSNMLIPLPLLKQFLYRDSFSLIFSLKINILLINKAYLSYANNGIVDPGITLVEAIFSLISSFPAITKMLVKREQGYQPYVPRTKDIQQLAAVLKPEALDQRLKSEASHLSCSYHLLKFMQENPPAPSRTAFFSGPSENKTSADTLLSSQDDKLGGSQPKMTGVESPLPTTITSSSWSPRLHWRLLQRNPSQVAEDKLSLSVPVAVLGEENSEAKLMTLKADFNSPYDQSYTKKRLDISFEMHAFDAAIRGSSVAGQFTFGLPKGLSLSSGITSFRF